MLLVGWQRRHPACKNWVVRYWRGYLCRARCKWCDCHPIISCSSKIQNGLPFWCRLTQVILEKRPLNGSSVVVLVVLLVLFHWHWTAGAQAATPIPLGVRCRMKKTRGQTYHCSLRFVLSLLLWHCSVGDIWNLWLLHQRFFSATRAGSKPIQNWLRNHSHYAWMCTPTRAHLRGCVHTCNPRHWKQWWRSHCARVCTTLHRTRCERPLTQAGSPVKQLLKWRWLGVSHFTVSL